MEHTYARWIYRAREDGSEVESKRDPNNPDDDTVKPPRTITVVPGNKYLDISFWWLSLFSCLYSC